MSSLIRLMLVSALALGAAACNTVQGAGQDIESVGKEGEEVIKGD
ncbi:entericidin A/B family lipoprotein [Pedomonas sp.]